MRGLARLNGGGIPAYAGMTKGGAGVTMRESGMDGERRQYAQDRALRALSPYSPGALVIPAKAGTYPSSAIAHPRLRGRFARRKQKPARNAPAA